MANFKVGIIGGTGLDNPDILSNRAEIFVTTPFGKPSDCLITGNIEGVPCVLLSRHGRKHSLSPSQVNYRANIYALKEEGCTHVIVTTASGSLQEHIRPGDIVLIDQFIDRTTKRSQTFFDGTPGGPVGVSHIPMGDPFCNRTRSVLARAAESLAMRLHPQGTVVTIEGPRFSTRAESHLFQSWGCGLVNMTTVPEVCLAKELGLCYASIALPTDYDCWKEQAVNVEMVMEQMKESSELALRLIVKSVSMLSREDWTDTIQQAQEMAKSAVTHS